MRHHHTQDDVAQYIYIYVFEVVLQKSIATQVRQLVLYISNSKDKLTDSWEN